MAEKMLSGIIRRSTALVMIILAAYFMWHVYDMYIFTRHGSAGLEYHDFGSLLAVNPDTVAWLRLEGTGIDHPVVQGRDNFEYLNKDFEGNDYAGGCLFLDEKCRRDMSGGYIIIHGHNMEGGAMFGSLGRFLDEDFFVRHGTGELICPDMYYSLTAAGAMTADAYDSDIYHVPEDGSIPYGLQEMCTVRREVEFRDGDKMVVLSTCSGDMSNDRTVLILRARPEGDKL